MPTITRTHDQNRPRRGEEVTVFPRGWCELCYAAGQCTVAADAVVGTVCAVHLADPGAPTPAAQDAGEGRPVRRRREGPHRRPPGRTEGRRRRRPGSRAPEVALAAGRARAAARVDAGTFAPHPGWSHWIPAGRLVDQAVVLDVVEQLLARQQWRGDRRTAWTAILRRLVWAANWPDDPTRPARPGSRRQPPGLVTGCTVDELAAAAARSPRTVSRVIAWAVAEGLVVIVEEGASAAYLGAKKGRTPTYAFYRPPALNDPPAADPDPTTNPAPTSAEAVHGDLPTSTSESDKPLIADAAEPIASWPLFGVPTTAAERHRALSRLLGRLGLNDSLDRRGVSGVPRWRLRALFHPWWVDGWCPAAILWALHHHPDQPDHRRGDALRGARDPLRVLGHRLAPWTGRRHELPATLTGIPGDYAAPAAPPSPSTDLHAVPSAPTTAALDPLAIEADPAPQAGQDALSAPPDASERCAGQAEVWAHLAGMAARGVRPRPLTSRRPRITRRPPR